MVPIWYVRLPQAPDFARVTARTIPKGPWQNPRFGPPVRGASLVSKTAALGLAAGLFGAIELAGRALTPWAHT
jgi:hypothetical protein